MNTSTSEIPRVNWLCWLGTTTGLTGSRSKVSPGKGAERISSLVGRSNEWALAYLPIILEHFLTRRVLDSYGGFTLTLFLTVIARHLEQC